MYFDNQQRFQWQGQERYPALKNMLIYSDFVLTHMDSAILINALNHFGLWEKSHPAPRGDQHLSIMILAENGKVNLSLEENVLGTSCTLFLIHWNRVRSLQVDYNIPPEIATELKVALLLEEMCHGLYIIRDEWQVKELVIQILHQTSPSIRLHDLFPLMFDENDVRILPS